MINDSDEDIIFNMDIEDDPQSKNLIETGNEDSDWFVRCCSLNKKRIKKFKMCVTHTLCVFWTYCGTIRYVSSYIMLYNVI